MTPTQFKNTFPEFQNIPDSTVQSFANFAALEVDARAWGSKTEMGIAYLTAHKLTLSPYGQGARTAEDGQVLKGSTLYWREYERLMYMVAGGPRAISRVPRL